ncbi:MAG: SnoaL-like domain-containing protein [Mucilaginibacter sp.]|uniref:SnoaL-like domain-containing protein n=1 Tax=Mucilaginibacter sp. TaxID=1882438 RepID=UPI0031B4A721
MEPMNQEIPQMSTKGIAEKFVQLCREWKNTEFKTMFYAEEITRIEAQGKKITGLQAVLQCGLNWRDKVQHVNSVQISDPIIAEDYFAVSMRMDVSYKDGTRSILDEICVYGVKDGKIISEQFFFNNKF